MGSAAGTQRTSVRAQPLGAEAEPVETVETAQDGRRIARPAAEPGPDRDAFDEMDPGADPERLGRTPGEVGGVGRNGDPLHGQGDRVGALDPHRVAQVDLGEDGVDLVIAVGPAAEHLEVEVELRGSLELNRRARGHGSPG